MAVEHRRRGRPPLVEGEHASKINVRLTNAVHDEACRIAIRADVSLSAVIRAALKRALLDEHGEYLSLYVSTK